MERSDPHELYAMMVRIEACERKLLWLLDQGRVSGFYHSGRGQEAIPAGACAAIRRDDYILYAHRGIGYQVAKGLPLEKLFGDFLSNLMGTTGGLGAGTVHIACPPLGILGQGGTLGSCFPIAAGAGLSAKYRGSDQVVVCFFGDGTSNRGTFHEAANAVAVWKLPVVWLCENNGYGGMVRAASSMSVKDVAARGSAYSMPGTVVDGQDPEAVYAAVSNAVTRARSGEGPSLIEAKTYRFRGHYEGDPQTYRPAGEVDAIRRHDPIPRLAERLLSSGRANEGQLEELRRSIDQEIEAAYAAGSDAQLPGPERIAEHLYSERIADVR